MKTLLMIWTLTLFIMIGLSILIATDEYNPKFIKLAGFTNHFTSAISGLGIYIKSWKESRK